MSRRRPPDRLERILDAALTVFARLGLGRAKMSEVATEAGVSQGTLYNYVESKEALFYLLMDRFLGGTPSTAMEFPVHAPDTQVLAARTAEAVARSFALPALDRALRRRRVVDAGGELAEIIDELFERTVATRQGADALERSALDMPELASVFYGATRRSLFERFARLVKMRSAAGHYRSIEPATGAKLIVETVTTFARHAYNDRDPIELDLTTAPGSVRDVLVAGLLSDRAP
jgi:AcrR family transcriptional regulator